MFHSQTLMTVSLLLLLLALAVSITTTKANVQRILGVSSSLVPLYMPHKGNTWVCLNNEQTISFDQVNDDYCDCDDGSDEPGTSACMNGSFHCVNIGHISLDIPSSRVNDGVCDCCDGTDEFIEGEDEKCENVCNELGREEEEKRRCEAEIHKLGAAKREEMVTKGKLLQTDRIVRRAELEKQRIEQEELKIEREELKRKAEANEAEALEVYREQQREQDAVEVANSEEPQNMRIEAEASFIRYDTNKDGFVEVTELQIDLTFDRDRNGVVTVEEAKYFLDERDRIDLDAFITLSWPRIKPMQMLVQGLFKPPQLKNVNKEADNKEVEATNDEKNKEIKESTAHDEFDVEEEEEGYDDDDADVGVGTVTAETTPGPEYDPETQRFIDIANNARNALSDVERALREIDHEIKEIEEQNAKDYGPQQEFATMDGECYKFEDREYIYTLCPFDRASQKPRNGGSETTLGRWEHWVGEIYKYTAQKYSHGASCWNGPQRSVIVELKCALNPAIISVTEPNRCEYFFELETPAACDHLVYSDASDEKKHDEL